MSIEEFDKTQFKTGMKCWHQGKLVNVLAVDFDERLLGVSDKLESSMECIQWARCENIIIEN